MHNNNQAGVSLSKKHSNKSSKREDDCSVGWLLLAIALVLFSMWAQQSRAEMVGIDKTAYALPTQIVGAKSPAIT